MLVLIITLTDVTDWVVKVTNQKSEVRLKDEEVGSMVQWVKSPHEMPVSHIRVTIMESCYPV